jgi:FkbM family methyltransferase
MARVNKILNFKRINFRYRLVVITYLIKKLLGVKPTLHEKNIYLYYNFLISYNGCFLQETDKEIISEFKNKYTNLIKLRKSPSSDFYVFQQVFDWHEYKTVVEEYNQNFSSGNKLNIIDAGSNIGISSLFMYDFFDEPNIVAIEPEQENFKILEFNLINKKNITKIKAGLWSSNTFLNVVSDFRDKSDWSFRVEKTTDSNGIKAFSINQIIEDFNFQFIDILKIDVEGSEKQIFTSDNADLSFLNITKCIAVEIHDEFNCRDEINSILQNYGFIFFKYGELTIGINQNLKNK